MLAAASWLVLVHRMGGMDSPPGGDLGGLGWFAGIWLTMTAAMMLPALVPAVAVRGSGHDRDRLRTVGATGPFLAGYLLAWMLLGLVGYALVKSVYSGTRSPRCGPGTVPGAHSGGAMRAMGMGMGR
jgi:predicted metal-binding membrane protein